MKIELLYFDGCPSYQTAEKLLREALAEEGQAAEIELIRIENDADVQRWKFVGSPTIRFDGVDPFMRGESDYGLECRVFNTPEGLQGWPTKMMLREALKQIRRNSMAIDPICGMQVDENTAKHKVEYKGQRYYFCSPGCKFTFNENPEDYVGPNRKPYAEMGGHKKM